MVLISFLFLYFLQNSYGSYDFNGEDHNPMPDVSTIYNSHGTRCAGLVAAVVSIHVYMYIYMYMYRWN